MTHELPIEIAAIAAKFANWFSPLSKLYSANWKGAGDEVLTLTTFATKQGITNATFLIFSTFPTLGVL